MAGRRTVGVPGEENRPEADPGVTHSIFNVPQALIPQNQFRRRIDSRGGGGWGGLENKVNSSFKHYYFIGYGRLDSILGSYSILGIVFPHNSS